MPPLELEVVQEERPRRACTKDDTKKKKKEWTQVNFHFWEFLGTFPNILGFVGNVPEHFGNFLGTSLTLSRDLQANWSRCHGSSWNLPSTRLKIFFRSAIGNSESSSEVKKRDCNLGTKFGNEKVEIWERIWEFPKISEKKCNLPADRFLNCFSIGLRWRRRQTYVKTWIEDGYINIRVKMTDAN
jgi:hypothetical protein